MKKGYTVILSLRYREEVEIETEEEDEAKIMETAAIDFVDGMRGTGDSDDIMGEIKAVNIKRNYSEKPESLLTAKEKLKDYIVWFFSRSSEIYVTVPAINKTEAEEKAEKEITLELTSEDGKTVCVVNKLFLEGTELAEWEKED